MQNAGRRTAAIAACAGRDALRARLTCRAMFIGARRRAAAAVAGVSAPRGLSQIEIVRPGERADRHATKTADEGALSGRSRHRADERSRPRAQKAARQDPVALRRSTSAERDACREQRRDTDRSKRS